MKTGAEGAYTLQTPLGVRLDGLEYMRETGQEDSMHNIIGDMYKVMQLHQILVIEEGLLKDE